MGLSAAVVSQTQSAMVILSNYYDLPFNDILDWRKFYVILKETDVYLLKGILKSISEKHFLTLNQNLVKIQKYFKWNTPPARLDAFHMVMYELWLRRHLIRY
ncbi:glycosyltransferase protein [Spatholobus suberectus]|nr:glycosyltransferase protein [Spatholobus suberectus]